MTPAKPKRVTATWTGAERFFPAEGRTVAAGDQIEVWDYEVDQHPYLEAPKPKPKPKTKTAGASGD